MLDGLEIIFCVTVTMDFLLTHTMLERAVRGPSESYENQGDSAAERKKLADAWKKMTMSQKVGVFVRAVFEILMAIIAVRMTWACSGKDFVGVVLAIMSFFAPHIAIPYHVMIAQSKCSAYWV
jgi:hypothetical protein